MPLGLLALLVIPTGARTAPTVRPASCDMVGAALLVAWTAPLLFTVRWLGPERGWRNSLSVALPSVHVFRSRQYGVAAASGHVVNGAMPGTSIYLPMSVQIVRRASSPPS